jgi:hypothetical protein
MRCCSGAVPPSAARGVVFVLSRFNSRCSTSATQSGRPYDTAHRLSRPSLWCPSGLPPTVTRPPLHLGTKSPDAPSLMGVFHRLLGRRNRLAPSQGLARRCDAGRRRGRLLEDLAEGASRARRGDDWRTLERLAAAVRPAPRSQQRHCQHQADEPPPHHVILARRAFVCALGARLDLR